MREWRRCPQCGYTKAGACPQCFPGLAEREQQAELAAWRREQDDQERRAAGMLLCPEHEVHDGCWEPRLRPEQRGPTWPERMAELRRRYASP